MRFAKKKKKKAWEYLFYIPTHGNNSNRKELTWNVNQWSTPAEHLLAELSFCELEQKARGVSPVLRMNQWKGSSEGGRGQLGSRVRAAGVPSSASGETYQKGKNKILEIISSWCVLENMCWASPLFYYIFLYFLVAQKPSDWFVPKFIHRRLCFN